MHPILILIALIGVLVFVSWVKRQPPSVRKGVVNRALIFAGLALLLFLLLTGRVHPLLALAGAAIPLVQRLLLAARVLKVFKSVRGPSAGQSSEVETRFLRMTLDHDTGQMTGIVLEGRFKGRKLTDMAINELLMLLHECKVADEQSATVLEAYMDRVHGDQWREESAENERGPPPSGASMSRTEAYEVLDLRPGATPEEIVEAHRRLMQKLHPDRGGSTFLAAKINQAKDVLLGT